MRLNQLDANKWEIKAEGDMRVPGLVFSDEKLLADIQADNCLRQVMNVACLPGIVGHSLAMPDAHQGYGFPIGGVAAFDVSSGIISPGGVGYDINCGCRLMLSNLETSDVKPLMKQLLDDLFNKVPCGVGSRGNIKLKQKELKKVLTNGAAWAVKNGWGEQGDLNHIEEYGAMAGADPDALSDRALERGLNQLGTLGSGNHFLELGRVAEIYDKKTAGAFGLFEDQVTVMVHSGSRGLGYQVCDDYIKTMMSDKSLANRELPDRQLVNAPVESKPGKMYFSAMVAAANYAFANRQILMQLTKDSIERTLGLSPRQHGFRLLYDVAHNIAKMENHEYAGKKRRLCVHRKGATRSLPAGHADLPAEFTAVGQPVLIPGDMGRYSYVLTGSKKSLELSFGSSCHGAGRILSRTAARKKAKGRSIARELAARGIEVRYTGKSTLKEEMPEAYKDVSRVVDVTHNAGLAKKVARLEPMGVIKG